MKALSLISIAVIFFGFMPAMAVAASDGVVIVQQSKEFKEPTRAGKPLATTTDSDGTKVYKVKVGEKIHLPNKDDLFHNAFSLSEGHEFDLGSYTNGETRSYKVEKPGNIEIECAIHPNMRIKLLAE